MKCPSCTAENKDTAAVCKKCGVSMTAQPLYAPTKEWHLKTLAVIYGVLIVVFFFLNWLLKPYMRAIPPEVTPWMQKGNEIHK
ncbi:MAG: hypothetical protein A2901_00140 [Elusimicrobia bacterium RIFCSPLOWO2_01_FULL_54_10]|nr:MAG: hypothetical protein A2901_00140 [Elusimicrobia bacterium RIFCSPLOWO2_01_FULL_54_10]